MDLTPVAVYTAVQTLRAAYDGLADGSIEPSNALWTSTMNAALIARHLFDRVCILDGLNALASVGQPNQE